MQSFAIGHTLVLLLVHIVNASMARRTWTIGDHFNTGAVLVLIPVATALAVAGFIQTKSPRRILCTASPSGPRRFMLGACAAIFTLSFMALLVIVAAGSIHEWLIAIIASTAATALVIWGLCKRPQPGHCLICNYDISASLPQGRCPECGTPISASLKPQRGAL